MLAGGVLQREPVSVHRAVLGGLLPGAGPHEDGVRPHPRLAPLRLRDDLQEHHGHAAGGPGHGHLQLGRRFNCCECTFLPGTNSTVGPPVTSTATTPAS